MPPTQAASGFGTKLKVGDGGGPENFATILENFEIAGPAVTREAIDATNHDSPDGYREFIPGLKDGGEVTGTGNTILDSSQLGILTDLENGTLRNFELEIPVKPTPKKWSFAALVTSFEPAEPIDDKMTYTITLKVSGKPTLA